MIELSVIIPTYNRAELLLQCLGALARQTQAATDFEVIIVVDGSTDGTGERLTHLDTPFRLRVERQPNRGAAAARNTGAQRATGRYCLFLDDDILVEPTLVAEHLAVHRAGSARELVVGIGQLTCRVAPRADGLAQHFALWWRDHYAELAKGRQPTAMDCWSGNLSMPLEGFVAVGGFDPGAGHSHDVELGYRLERHGLRFVYVDSALGHQQFGKGFREIASDVELTGLANFELFQRHPSMLRRLALAAFDDARLRFVLALRLLLALNPPLEFLRLASPALGHGRFANSWYGLLFAYFYWRGVRRGVPDADTWRKLMHGTPILLYHAFGRAGEAPSRYVVPGKRFARQMALLRRAGVHVLDMEQWLQMRQACRLPPAPSVVITIDDGYADVLDVGHPKLRQHGFPATTFVVSGAVGGSNHWDTRPELAGRKLLAWEQLRWMRSAGASFGAHSRSHVRLSTLVAAQLRDEIEGSRADLERELGQAVAAFAYPYGDSGPVAESQARQAGFLGACGIQPGRNSAARSDFGLRRTEIRGTDSLLRFALVLWLGDALRERGLRGRGHGG